MSYLFLIIGTLVYAAICAIIKDGKKLTIFAASYSCVVLIYTVQAVIFGDSFAFKSGTINFAPTELGSALAVITAIMFTISAFTSIDYFKDETHHLSSFYTSYFLTFAGCLGVFLAADLFTLFIFFELLSFSSYIWVSHSRDKIAKEAAKTYLGYAVFGGISLLFGIVLLVSEIGILPFSEIYSNLMFADEGKIAIASVLMIIGFGAKAGLFLFHDWLPRAHAVSPSPTSALLSGLLTKSGIYGIAIVILNIYNNQNFLFLMLSLALCNMIYGAVMALLSSDIKRTLAFSSISQIGFIIFGIVYCSMLGEEGSIAIYGVLFHIINHSAVKTLLFNIAGIIHKEKHSYDLNKIKGSLKNKPIFAAVFAIGAASLSGIPFIAGYISKTLLHESAVEYIHLTHTESFFIASSEILFLVAGGITFCYMLKLFVCLVIKNSDDEKSEKKASFLTSGISLSVVAATLVVFGIFPKQTLEPIGLYIANTFNLHGLSHSIDYLAFVNLRGALISLSIGIVLYIVILPVVACKKGFYTDYIPQTATVLDRIYLPIISVGKFGLAILARLFDIFVDLIVVITSRLFLKSAAIPKSFFEGKPVDEKERIDAPHITYSLAFSLLLFGIGFIFTLIYLLVIEFRV